MNTDEFYHILRRRLFKQLPDEAEIEAVAQGLAGHPRGEANDVTNACPEQFAVSVKASYPFHPAIRDLYARFRENQGFQQTRGLIRLMRIVVSRIWSPIATHISLPPTTSTWGSQEPSRKSTRSTTPSATPSPTTSRPAASRWRRLWMPSGR